MRSKPFLIYAESSPHFKLGIPHATSDDNPDPETSSAFGLSDVVPCWASNMIPQYWDGILWTDGFFGALNFRHAQISLSEDACLRVTRTFTNAVRCIKSAAHALVRLSQEIPQTSRQAGSRRNLLSACFDSRGLGPVLRRPLLSPSDWPMNEHGGELPSRTGLRKYIQEMK